MKKTLAKRKTKNLNIYNTNKKNIETIEQVFKRTITGWDISFSNIARGRAYYFLFSISAEFSFQSYCDSIYKQKAFVFILDELGLYEQLKGLYVQYCENQYLRKRYIR